ncbi:Cupin domain protein [Roseomonas sp. TAS13]|uniref:cupin domain-containing protein n=1 Tax=Roseomonas sp. TAS13 TaxID=1926319 RepID=UPI0009618B8D|nr:cupin domain-containing protein [Roseomonas sp. TAS13]USQ72592.1 cupin domain-containing protein [Roseomonas mucosa]GAV34397.1 Cupin domain protein [Roseomonas sp. TAS13]
MPDGTIAKTPAQAGQVPASEAQDWRNNGIKVVKAGARSCDTPETLGMNREVAISGSRNGSQHLWAGTNLIRPGHPTGPHHHGALESIIYVVRGHALMRWGSRLEFITEAKAGDFMLVPPYLPHQELNASDTEDLHCVLVRSGTEEVIVNLDDLDIVDEPEWIRPE